MLKMSFCIVQKEQALELSAKIGQTLVLKTNHLATKIKALEQQVEARGDQVGSFVSVYFLVFTG